MFRRRDVEEIDAKHETHGAMYAMQHLLLVLPVQRDNWFEHLMTAMKYNGYEQIVSTISGGKVTTVSRTF